MSKNRAEDQAFEQAFKKSISVSSYADEIIDKIYNNKEIPKNMVPDYSDGMGQVSHGNESTSLFRLDDDMMFATAASTMGVNGLSAVLGATQDMTMPQPQNQPSIPMPSKPQFKISQNQYTALKKYPALVEFLGSEGGASLVKEIAAKVNEHMISKIGENSKEISKYAQVCVSDRQNIKQYFAGENKEWVCVVTASGPFRGDEAFFYKPENDESYILRKANDDYEDVTKLFNVIHEYAKSEDTNE